MSDSGVFESLQLQEVLHAGKQEGVYHNNVFVTVKLASPHLKDPSGVSVHEVGMHGVTLGVVGRPCCSVLHVVSVFPLRSS